MYSFNLINKFDDSYLSKMIFFSIDIELNLFRVMDLIF